MVKNSKIGKKNANKKGRMSAGKMVAIGAGAAAVGAGAYYFLGPKGKKHQKKAKVLVAKMAKAKKEMGTEWKDLKNKARPALKQVNKTVKKAAGAMKKISNKSAN